MRRISSIAPLVAVAIAACRDAPELTRPPQLTAEVAPESWRFDVVTLPTFDASPNRGSAINNQGWVAGYVTRSTGARHAALWRNRVVSDLGTLGGRNSSVHWPGLSNNSRIVVGISQTAIRDTLGEDWSCSAFLPASDSTCVGFYYAEGRMRALPTLGGDHGFAAGVNNKGQIVGWAETAVRDSTCNAPQKLGFKAVLWEPFRGRMRPLSPYPGHSASAATAINEKGQAVGISGDCDVAVGRYSAKRAVLWEKDGSVIDIGNLGADSWHTPMAISENSAVVGFSVPPGDTSGAFVPHAFLWTRQGGIQNLGKLTGDSTSQALGINSRRQIVGVSTSAVGISRAFLWENGVMMNLNDLVSPEFPDSLASAQHINDAGRITGRMIRKADGANVPFILIPRAQP
jgi:probable HAF family extracellular repeat protein